VHDLRGTKTLENLQEAFARASQDNRRFLDFATKADIEGLPEIASLLRSVAEGETMHAFGHLDLLSELGEWTGSAETSSVVACLKTALELEDFEYSQMYPGFARTARDEGFDEVAEWFEVLVRAQRSHAEHFARATEALIAWTHGSNYDSEGGLVDGSA
jgi:rubrerythrin